MCYALSLSKLGLGPLDPSALLQNVRLILVLIEVRRPCMSAHPAHSRMSHFDAHIRQADHCALSATIDSSRATSALLLLDMASKRYRLIDAPLAPPSVRSRRTLLVPPLPDIPA